MTPANLLFAKTHEWLRVEPQADGGRVATVGVSDFALQALTDLVHVELPKKGRQLKAGEPFGEIESVKAVSDLYSPISGEIVAVHEGVVDQLDALKDDPYGKGWLIQVRLSNEGELKNLLAPAAYEKQCAEEGH
ncbi:MAG: glycine cleavage system protein GcvH [Planctomycetes bacterium]|nr:glycine cleavage system protein GcvH [Planctomycetota bacterium]